MTKYFPASESSDDCPSGICTCTTDGTWEIQQGRVQLNEESGGRGFGMHLVNLTKRETTGGIALEAVEAAFTTRLGDMSKFDAFMDHHVGLYTDDLAKYTSVFDDDNVPYYLMSWTTGSDKWFSASVHVPNTQLIIELLSKNYTEGASLRASQDAPSPRLSESRANELNALETNRDYVYAVRISRAVTNLTAMDEFYVGALGATSVEETDQRHCYKVATTSSFTDTTEVCFNEHADDKHDVLSVEAYTAGMNGVHQKLLKGKPKCGMDKYLDNHLAIDPTEHGSTTFGDNIVDYINKHDDVLYYCEPAMGPGASGYQMHYIIDPTGFGVQVDTQFSEEPAACSSRRRLQGHSNPACDLGDCS